MSTEFSRRLLGVAGEAETLDVQGAPAILVERVPRAGATAGGRPPMPHQAKIMPAISCVSKTRSLAERGRVGEGRGDALPAGVELVTVERTDQAAVANPAARGRSQLGTKMRTDRLGDRHPAGVVAPSDDFLPHPGLLDQARLLERPPTGDEIPPLRKRGERVFTHAY